VTAVLFDIGGVILPEERLYAGLAKSVKEVLCGAAQTPGRTQNDIGAKLDTLTVIKVPHWWNNTP
jgi:hypothetical protein